MTYETRKCLTCGQKFKVHKNSKETLCKYGREYRD